jgi:hypothetical protein
MTQGETAAGGMDPVVVVQRQLDAYNARHLARFPAEYSEDIRVYRQVRDGLIFCTWAIAAE